MEKGVDCPLEEMKVEAHSRPESKEVALRAQVVTSGQHKAIMVLSVVMFLLALAGFSYSLVFKSTSAKVLFEYDHVQVVNTCFSSLNVIVLGTLLLMFTYNLILVHRANLKWTARKRTMVYIVMAQLVVQFTNSVFFLAPNSYSWVNTCSWFHKIEFVSGFIRWSCWNSLFCLLAIHTHNICPWTDREGKLRRKDIEGNIDRPLLIMDAKLWVHLPKLVIWACFEFCIIYLAAAYPDDFNFRVRVVTKKAGVPCTKQTYSCKSGVAYKALTTLWIAFLFLYLLIIQAYIRRTRQRLLLAPYKDFINVHLMVLQLKTQVWYVALLGVAMVPVLWYTRWQRCNNYFVAWLGLLPFQMIATSVVFANAFYFMPMRPGNKSILQEWLQEFAWLERDLGAAISKRSEHDSANGDVLRKEPMFCFESGIKLLLWAELVYYDYKDPEETVELEPETATKGTSVCCFRFCVTKDEEEGQTATSIPAEDGLEVEAAGQHLSDPVSEKLEKQAAEPSDCRALLGVAMEMYDLDNFEVIHEVSSETRVLIAWSTSTIVIAFRGTAGMANVRADAKAWRTPHLPVRGQWFLGTQPLVHKGFLETWRANNLDRRVMARVESILDTGKVSRHDFSMYLTGHSLGGALATLAAFDLQTAFGFPKMHVYTYGAPRTGNHAFAREYAALVPHTWHVINDRDAVPRSGKFWILYKRPGQRTLVNQVGDLRVRPAFLEVCLHTTGFSIKQHFMASYLRALWSVCVAQCIPGKKQPGGRRAVDILAASPQMQAYFATLDLDIKALAEMPEERVSLPSLTSNKAVLHGGCCNWGVVDYFSGLLEDLLPFSENASAALSLLNHGGVSSEDAQLEELRQGHLARRLSTMELQRRATSPQERQLSSTNGRPLPSARWKSCTLLPASEQELK